MTAKERVIQRIKKIIEEFGSFTTADVEPEGSPVITTAGKNVCVLAEGFNTNTVKAVTYVHETETDSEEISYEDLAEDVLCEIELLAENYEADQLKTLKRCSN